MAQFTLDTEQVDNSKIKHARKMFEACEEALLAKPCRCNKFRPMQLPGYPWHGECSFLRKAIKKTTRSGKTKLITVYTYVEDLTECPRGLHHIEK